MASVRDGRAEGIAAGDPKIALVSVTQIHERAVGSDPVFRAHQVRPTRRVVEMAAAIRGTRAPMAARRGLI